MIEPKLNRYIYKILKNTPEVKALGGVFWNDNTQNYPSSEMYGKLDALMVDYVGSVSFSNFFASSLTFPTDDLLYIKQIDTLTRTTKFYFTSNITMISKGSFKYDLVLDIYMSYINNILLTNTSIPFLINRSHQWDENAKLFVDPKLEEVPKIQNSFSYKKEAIPFTYEEISGVQYLKYQTNAGSLYSRNDSAKPIRTNFNRYYIFNATIEDGDNQWLIIPVLTLPTTPSGSHMYWKATSSAPFVFIDNSDASIENIKNDVKLINKFEGIFYLPDITKLNISWTTFKYPSTSVTYLMGKFLPQFPILLSNFKIYETTTPSRTHALNISTRNNILTDRYLSVKFYGKEIDIVLLQKNNSIILNGMFAWCGNGVIVNNNNLINLENNVIEYPLALPSTSNTYLQYVHQTQNTANTSFWTNIAMGATNTLTGIGMGTYNRVSDAKRQNNSIDAYNQKALSNPDLELRERASSGYGFAAQQGILQGTTSLTSALGSGINLIAQYEASKNAMGVKMNTTNINSLSLMLKYENIDNENPHTLVEVMDLNENTYRLLNNVLYYYGFYNPKMSTIFNEFTSVPEQDFRYIEFDEAYLNTILKKLLANLYPQTILNTVLPHIIKIMSSGMRIWNSLK